MNKCKRCNCTIPNSHKGEWAEHDCLCRKCYHIKHSKYKDLKNKQRDLEKIPNYFIKEEEEK